MKLILMVLVLFFAACQSNKEYADLIVINSNIYTEDGNLPISRFIVII